MFQKGVRTIKDNFLVEVSSVQSAGRDKDEMKVKTRGTMKEINGKIYIAYSDYENNEACQCVIKAEQDKRLTIIKSGRVCSRMILEKGKKHYCPYTVKEGTLVLGVFTDDIDVEYSEESCNINLRYALDMNSQFIGTNELSIKANRIEN